VLAAPRVPGQGGHETPPLPESPRPLLPFLAYGWPLEAIGVGTLAAPEGRVVRVEPLGRSLSRADKLRMTWALVVVDSKDPLAWGFEIWRSCGGRSPGSCRGSSRGCSRPRKVRPGAATVWVLSQYVYCYSMSTVL